MILFSIFGHAANSGEQKKAGEAQREVWAKRRRRRGKRNDDRQRQQRRQRRRLRLLSAKRWGRCAQQTSLTMQQLDRLSEVSAMFKQLPREKRVTHTENLAMLDMQVPNRLANC